MSSFKDCPIVNADYIRALQSAKGISNLRISGLLGISRNTYDMLVKGQHVNTKVISLVAQYFGVPAWTLIKGSPTEGIRIKTSGETIPDKKTESSSVTVIGTDPMEKEIDSLKKEIEVLKKEIELKDELLSLYRKLYSKCSLPEQR